MIELIFRNWIYSQGQCQTRTILATSSFKVIIITTMAIIFQLILRQTTLLNTRNGCRHDCRRILNRTLVCGQIKDSYCKNYKYMANSLLVAIWHCFGGFICSLHLIIFCQVSLSLEAILALSWIVCVCVYIFMQILLYFSLVTFL